jgi:hypothetical protein
MDSGSKTAVGGTLEQVDTCNSLAINSPYRFVGTAKIRPGATL